MASFRSIISIIKAAARNDANATLNALGDFGPMTYLVGLSTDGSWPPTHYVSSRRTRRNSRLNTKRKLDIKREGGYFDHLLT